MKKKLLIILSMVYIIVMFLGCAMINKPSLIGRYLKTSDGKTHIIIDETGGPIVMGNGTNKEDLFDGLQSGDKIEVKYDGAIRESYPAGTDVYSCNIIERGTKIDISKEVLKSLEEMGWTFDFTQLED